MFEVSPSQSTNLSRSMRQGNSLKDVFESKPRDVAAKIKIESNT